MTVSVESAISGPFTPNGVTTSFPFTFKAGSATEVGVVDQDGTALSTALYSVSLDDDEGGSVLFSVAPALADYGELYIVSTVALTQTADFDNAGTSFNPAALTRALDRAAVRDLKQQLEIDRTFKVPFGEDGPTFPSAAERANLYPVFDADGNLSTSAGTGADAGMRTDLAATTGAGLVGLPLGGTLDQVINYVTPEQFGASDTADSSDAFAAAWQAAVDNDWPLVINGTVKIDSPLALDGNVEITGTGTLELSDATLDDDPDTGGWVLKVGSGVTAMPALAADIGVFATTVQFAAAHGLALGDVFAVWNPTDYSQSLARPYYRQGAMFRVAGIVSNTTVTIFGVARELFDKDDVQVFKLDGGFFRASGVKIIPPATGTPLKLDGLVDVTLDGLRSPSSGNDRTIEIWRCYNIGISDPDLRVLTGEAYPIVLSNSQVFTVNASRGLYSRWHCLALGGNDGDATVPTADGTIIGMVGRNISSNGVAAADIHGGCQRIDYVSCDIGMGTLAGEDVSLVNCRITGRPSAAFSDGCCIFGSEVVGGKLRLQGCWTVSNGTTADFGNMLHLDLSTIRKDVHLIIRDHDHENVAADPSSTTMIELGVGSASPTGKKINVEIDGLKYIGATPPAQVMLVRGNNDVSAFMSVRMRGVRGVETLYVATAAENYEIDFEGPGMRRGVTGRGDEDVVLARVSTEYQEFTADLTQNRTVTLPTATRSAPGDTFVVVRKGAGAFTLTAGPSEIAQNEFVRLAFKGLSSLGSWVEVERGSLV